MIKKDGNTMIIDTFRDLKSSSAEFNKAKRKTVKLIVKTIFFKLSQFLNAQCLIVSTESGIMISLALQSTNDKGSSTVTPSSIINFSSSFTIIFSFLSFWIYTYNMLEIRHKKNAAPKALLQNYNRIEVFFPFFLIASIR